MYYSGGDGRGKEGDHDCYVCTTDPAHLYQSHVSCPSWLSVIPTRLLTCERRTSASDRQTSSDHGPVHSKFTTKMKKSHFGLNTWFVITNQLDSRPGTNFHTAHINYQAWLLLSSLTSTSTRPLTWAVAPNDLPPISITSSSIASLQQR